MNLRGKTREQLEAALAHKSRSELLELIYSLLTVEQLLKPSEIAVRSCLNYDNMPIEAVTSSKKTVNVDRYYNKERLRPLYTDFEMQPLFIMASD